MLTETGPTIPKKAEKAPKTGLSKPALILIALLWLGVLAALVVLRQSWPTLRFDYSPHQLTNGLPNGSTAGFYQPETDDKGNHYVWTADHARLNFDFQTSRPLKLGLSMRSAAVAGGPDAPVVVLVNGTEVAKLHPDPARADFQTFELKITPSITSTNRLQIELQTDKYQAPNDPRLLGTMLNQVRLDKEEAWSGIGRRTWLYWSLPLIGLLLVGLFWMRRRWAVAGYALLPVGLNGTGFMLAAFWLLSRIGNLDPPTSAHWQLLTIYLGIVPLITTLVLPYRRAEPPTLSGLLREVLPGWGRKGFGGLRLVWAHLAFVFVLLLVVLNIPTLWSTLASPQTFKYADMSYDERQISAQGGMGEGLLYASRTLPKEAEAAVAFYNYEPGFNYFTEYWLYPRQLTYPRTLPEAVALKKPYLLLICATGKCPAGTDKVPEDSYRSLRQFSGAGVDFIVYQRKN
jgi:hypothetical protein